MRNHLFLCLIGVALLASCGNGQKEHLHAVERFSFKPVSSPADSFARYPHLLADRAKGLLWMSWMVQDTPDSASLWMAALSVKTGKWQEPKLVTAGKQLMVNWADYPHLLQQQSDHPGIAYLQVVDATMPYAYHVMLKQPAKGAQRLHSDSSATEHGFVSAAQLTDGQLATIWLDGNKYAGAENGHGHGGGGEMSLLFRAISSDSGTLLPPQELDGRTCDCCNTALVATANGGALAFYRDRSEQEVRDISYVRLQNGEWSKPLPLHEDGWEINACPVNGPAAAASGDLVAVAWFTGAGGKNKVNVRFSNDAGNSWSPVSIADSLQPMGRVGIQLLKSGNALLSWLNKEGQLVIRQISTQGKQGKVQVLADSLSSRQSGFPQLVSIQDKIYLAWTQPKPYAQLMLLEANTNQSLGLQKD